LHAATSSSNGREVVFLCDVPHVPASSPTAPPQLVVVGSLNADLIVSAASLPGPGQTVIGGTFEMAGGGKGANQAVAATRLGAPVALVGAVGRDDFGTGLIDELEEEGVNTDGVAALHDASTGVALIVVDESGENQIAVASGANGRLAGVEVARALERLDLSRARCALLSLEVSDEAVQTGAELAAARGLTVVVNPAPARPLPAALLALNPILTPNQGEAAALTGHEDPAAAAAALAQSAGAPAVVTAGARGAFLAGGDGVAEIEAPRVTARDTTGAGDTFNGALAAGLARDWELDRAARWATIAAALSVTETGARKGMPSARQVEAAWAGA
jgi:ribokinase